MGSLKWFSQILCLSFMLLQFRVQTSSTSQSSLDSPPHLCRPEELSALLEFKSTTSLANCQFGTLRPIIQTWNESKDCCLWDGITCDKPKGHVIGLDLSNNCLEANLTANSSLFRLEKLQSLNLSHNYFYYPNIPFGFNHWKSLTYLNLSDSGYMHGSLLFDEIFLLSKLVSLDLSYNDLILDNIKFQMLVHNLTELRFLILNSVNMSLVVPSSLLNLTSSLEHLSLRNCHFQGNFPSQVSQLTKLVSLDLSYNDLFLENVKFQMLVHNLTELRFLSLDSVNMSLVVFSSLLNLTSSLEHLSLSNCLLQGNFPSQVFQLTKLVSLDLSYNDLFLDNMKFQMLLTNLTKLRVLILNYVNMSLVMPSSLLNLTSSLEHLSLSSCNLLEGQIPDSIGKMHKLTHLSFCNNNFGGEIPTSISNLTHLTFLSLSSNKLFGRVPVWLFSLPSLSYLALRNNKLTGSIAHVGRSSLQEVYLSNNFLTGIDLVGFENLEIVDLRSNLLQGSLTIPSTTWEVMQQLLISGNHLTGEIPSFYCNLTSLIILDLANNSLGGKIPECLGNLSNLSILDLQMNKFHGRIPNSFVNNNWLSTLHLNDNQLEGILPQSLLNCWHLEVLDVRNNNLTDTFPYRLGVLPSLKVLILRSNRFHGTISNSMPAFYFPQLRIVDVAQNDFMGLLPGNYFKILKSMRDVAPVDTLEYIVDKQVRYRRCVRYVDCRDFYYKDFVKVVMKGLVVKLVKNLTIYTTVDFSSNQFHGSIPEELGELNSLLLLNLSHNSLNGQIPSSLGKLAELESLDLSSNKLEGRIPEQLTNLTFLSVLKLSHNELVGHIPEGKQFNTFSNDSYVGNSGLCGFPLTKKCHKEEEPRAPPSKFDEGDDSAALFEWKFALAGYGCGLVLGLSLGYIVFATGKPWWVVKKVENYQEKFVGRWICRRKKRKTPKPNQRS